jgi:hypothetical protein
MKPRKTIRIFSRTSALFFHVVSKPVHTLVIKYDEIFQALAVEGDILLPWQFLDLGFDCVVRWKSPASETFFQFAKHVEVQEGQVWAIGWWGWVRNGFGSRTTPSTARA